jgi:predicted DNA-binding protein with PD1-like motif
MLAGGEMQHYRLSGEFDRRFLLVLGDGDDLVAELTGFGSEQAIDAAEFTGVGSFAEVQLDGGRRCADVEVRSLDGKLEHGRVEAYAVVTSAGETCAGHVTRAVVRDTLKLVFTEGDHSDPPARPARTHGAGYRDTVPRG